MSGLKTAQPSEEPVAAGPSPEAVIQALDKILLSQQFHNAESQKAFLRYVVNETLAGRGDQLKEYTIGLEVFQRKDSYDPRYDSTVRLKAQKLRWGLAKYYETEGKDDQVCIGFRSRGYQPVFSWKSHAASGDPKTTPFEALTNQAVIDISSDARPDFSVVAKDARLAGSPRRVWRSPWVLGTLAAVIFLASVTLAWLAGSRHWLMRTHRKIDSIAVLPFRTLGGEAEFLGSGLTADLTDSLARIPGMGVIAPSSASVYKGKAVDVRDVGERLNVRAVLDGSIQQVGNRVRVNLLISDTRNGLPLWSATYDQEVKDIFQTQTDISDTVTNAVRLRLADAQASQSDNLADGQSGPGAGEAHARLGEAYAIDFRWAIAEPELLKAVELSPSRVTVRRTYATFLQKVGRLDDAEKQIKLDPYAPSAITVSNLARNLYFGRRYAEAIAEFQHAIRMYEPIIPGIHADLGVALVMNGMGQKGIEELKLAHRVSFRSLASFSGQLGYAYAVLGRTEDARRILAELSSRSDQGDSLSTAIAQVYIGLGQKDRAFEWLHKAIMQRDGNLFLKVDPIYDPLRKDAQFRDLIRAINLN
jgi:TolB-like protein/Flp pilus assembly protein TadD